LALATSMQDRVSGTLMPAT